MAERIGSGVEIEGVEEKRQRVPEWLGEAVLLGQYWLESGLVGRLEEEVRVVRGRMGQYEVADFVLMLNSYAVSGERTLSEFYKSIAPVKEVLMGVWGRRRCPSASSLSRFLAAVEAKAVEGLREMFEMDLGRLKIIAKRAFLIPSATQCHTAPSQHSHDILTHPDRRSPHAPPMDQGDRYKPQTIYNTNLLSLLPRPNPIRTK
jgi:hypothetical protein